MMDLASRVARRYIQAEVIPDKFFKGQAAKLRQILKKPVKEPGYYRYEFQDLVDFFPQFEKAFFDIVSKDVVRESVAGRVGTAKSYMEAIQAKLGELGVALDGYRENPTPKQALEWHIKYEIDKKLEEKVKTVGDLLKWSYRVEPAAIEALADKALKKATPEEIASLTDDNRYRTKWEFFRRIGIEQASQRLLKREKLEWKPDWVERIYEMLKANYSESSPRMQHELTEFTLSGMKVVILDSTVGGQDVKQYVKYLDEAYGRLKRKGLDAAWYGTIYIECEACGGKNENTGKDNDVGGWYAIRPNTVTVFMRPSSGVVDLVVHELGHRYWYKNMDSEQRARFESMVKVHTKDLPRGVATNFIKSRRYKDSVVKDYHTELDWAKRTRFKSTLVESPTNLYKRVIQLLEGFEAKPTVSDKAQNAWSRVKSFEDSLRALGKQAEETLDNFARKDESYTKWFDDYEQISAKFVHAALEYLDLAAEGHNDQEREKIMSTPEGKAYWESYEQNQGPVLPVSNYGRSNISEAFAEVFKDYVMGEDLTRDQLESFRSVISAIPDLVTRLVARFILAQSRTS